MSNQLSRGWHRLFCLFKFNLQICQSNQFHWSSSAFEVWIECNVKWDSCLWRGTLKLNLGQCQLAFVQETIISNVKSSWRRMACNVKSAFEWKTTRSLNLKETPTGTSIRWARSARLLYVADSPSAESILLQQTMAQRSQLHYPSKLGADSMIPNVDPKVKRTQTMKQALSITIAANFHSFFTSFSSSSLRNLAVILRISFRMQTMS